MNLENKIKEIESQINLISSNKQEEINKLQIELEICENKLNKIKDLQTKIKNIDEIAIPLIKQNTMWTIWDNSLHTEKYDRWSDKTKIHKGDWRKIESDIGNIDLDLKIEMLEKQKERHIIELKKLLNFNV